VTCQLFATARTTTDFDGVLTESVLPLRRVPLNRTGFTVSVCATVLCAVIFEAVTMRPLTLPTFNPRTSIATSTARFGFVLVRVMWTLPALSSEAEPLPTFPQM
jgi:hypothetical protein